MQLRPIFLEKKSRMLLDDAQYRCLLEVFNEKINGFLITKVIAPWEEFFNLQLLVIRALLPQVLTQPSFRSQLSVVWEVIVPLRVLEFILRGFFISDVKSDVKLRGVH